MIDADVYPGALLVFSTNSCPRGAVHKTGAPNMLHQCILSQQHTVSRI